MMKHYSENELEETFGKHPVILTIEEIEDAFMDIGIEIDLKSMVTPIEGSDARKAGLLITPDLSDALEDTLDDVNWLSVNEDINESFSDVKGSAELTNVVARKNLTIKTVVNLLKEAEYPDEDDTDMITKMKYVVEAVSQESDPDNPYTVVGYDMFRKALGWKAELFLSQTDDFHKELASLDQMGVDLGTNQDSPWNLAEDDLGFQLKTMQRITSQNLHNEDNEHPHLSYAWTENGIHVADMGERRGDDNQAQEMADRAGVRSKTIMKKSEKRSELKHYKRPARVIAWE